MAQKKKKKSKAVKDPVYNLKESEIRNHIINLLKYDEPTQRLMREEARRIQNEEAQKQSSDIDTLILATLHQEFGFGKSRLLRFAKSLEVLHKYYEDKYEDCDIVAMKTHLRDRVGLDVDNLEGELANATKKNTN